MSQCLLTITPLDHGREMRLDEFDRAEGQAGHLYELGRGRIIVVDVPGPRHFRQINEIRKQLTAYDLAHPGQIHAIAGGGECKILAAGFESERHPDLAVYMTPPSDEEDVWSTWVPQIVVEVVSPGSEQRDYVEKREEYLQFGVMEYWIVDSGRRELLVLRRSRGRWAEQIVRPPETCRTRLLPGFELICERVFGAAQS